MIRVPIQAMIGDENLGKHIKEGANPWFKVSVKIWFEVIGKYGLKNQCKLLRWIGHDSEFQPNRMDGTFGNWARGPKIFGELLQKGKIKSFQVLKGEFTLMDRDLFRYLQLRHYLEHIHYSQ